MPRACIYFGTHKHLVAKSECKDVIVQIKNEIKGEVERMPNVQASVIGIAIYQELLMKGIIDEKGDGKIL